MENILTPTELNFLSSQGLGPDDVMDVRGMPQWLWFKRIEEENMTVALGSRCRAAGHRLRSRRGHCVQCDTSKLSFVARYSADQYVYIAGSRLAKLMKFGTCRDCAQREKQLRAERYGGVGDWRMVYSVEVRNAGAVEDAARSRLSRYAVSSDYWKNNSRQTASEVLRCAFSQAESALLAAIRDLNLGDPWKSSRSADYEFAEAEESLSG
jgi:hypothetical protein